MYKTIKEDFTFFHRVVVLIIFIFILSLTSSAQSKIIKLNFQKNEYNPLLLNKNIYFDNAAFCEEFPTIPGITFTVDLNSGNRFNGESINIQIIALGKKSIKTDSLPKKYALSICDSLYSKTEIYGTKAQITIIPFIQNNGFIEFIDSFRIDYQIYKKSDFKSKGRIYAENSVLNTGDFYKIRIQKNGIYKISGADLQSMGFSLQNLTVDKVALYGNGGGMLPEGNYEFRYDDLQENSIKIFDLNSNGYFESSDYFIFYGKGPLDWKFDSTDSMFHHKNHLYDSYSYYFITINKPNAKRINLQNQPTNPASIIVDNFTDFSVHEKDSLNLIKSGKQWFGEKYDYVLSYNFSFNFPNINTNFPVKLITSVAARSFSPSSFTFKAGNSTFNSVIPSVCTDYTCDYAAVKEDTFSFVPSGQSINIISNFIKSTSSSIAWLDYLELIVTRNLSLYGNQMNFRNEKILQQSGIAEYQISAFNTNSRVWDITFPTNPQEIECTLNNGIAKFKSSCDTLKEFIVFNEVYLDVEKVGKVENQNLHALKNIDFIIITNPAFKEQAQKLADFHISKDGLTCKVIEPSIIYNEFSSGAADITAIRDFVKMLYDRGLQDTTMPKYLLLFGDGSYDYKNRISNNTNLVPTYQSQLSVSPTASYVSDDYFGLLDDNEGYMCNGILDIGIGRLPVATVQQAEEYLAKIKRYTATASDNNNQITNNNSGNIISNMADWRNRICFVGDDGDWDIHMLQSDFLAEKANSIAPSFNIDKIYFDAYTQITTPGGQRYPDAKKDLNNEVKNGALLINYTGHGSESGWAHESVLEIKDINAWTNYSNLPAFVTATCEFSRFDDPERVSAGEYVFLNPNGGGICLFTTTRIAYSGSNFELNKSFINSVFTKSNGKYPCLGDLIKNAKIGSGSLYPNRNFVLLGDPALRLSYPEYQITTTKINDKALTSIPDTLKSLDVVKIEGEIQDNGTILSGFNGTIYPTIYDKKQVFMTLGNDPESSPNPFILQNNIIYKGKVSVTNGKFEFSFIIPKDIQYNFGNGKISYYAENGIDDATGYLDTVIIGGSNPNPAIDESGPHIRLFMNDTNFRNGGVTNEDPLFLALLEDVNGINTIGNGIGHDLIATLDENTANPINLNSYYLADLNSYKSGKIRFPFENLNTGEHTITLKAWDVYNNSSRATLNFVVVSKEDITIKNLRNYPNPFSDFTNIIFEHNQDCEEFNVELEIFSVKGELVYKEVKTVNNTGSIIAEGELTWNGESNTGTQIINGFYIYKVTLKSCNGNETSKNQKLIYIK